MKCVKLLFAVVLSLVALGASAQFSVKAGYASSIWKSKSGDDRESTSLNGFRGGAAYDITLPVNGLSIRPGLNYTFGTYEKRSPTSFLRKTTLTEHSMSLPVDVKYAFKINDSFKVYAFAGPGFSVGLAMPVKCEFSGNIELMDLNDVNGYISRDGYSGKSKSDLSEEVLGNQFFRGFTDQRGIPRFDVAMRLGAGVQYKRAFVEFDYDFGLLNRVASGATGKSRRDELAVSLGVVF